MKKFGEYLAKIIIPLLIPVVTKLVQKLIEDFEKKFTDDIIKHIDMKLK